MRFDVVIFHTAVVCQLALQQNIHDHCLYYLNVFMTDNLD